MESKVLFGLECKHCFRHSPAERIEREHADGKGPESVSNAALQIGESYICLQCGERLRPVDELDISFKVGRILRTLVEDCMFRVATIFDKDRDPELLGLPAVYLINRSNPKFTCRLDSRVHGNEMQKLLFLDNFVLCSPYDPSSLTHRPPVVVDQTLRNLSDYGEWRIDANQNAKGADQGYARMVIPSWRKSDIDAEDQAVLIDTEITVIWNSPQAK